MSLRASLITAAFLGRVIGVVSVDTVFDAVLLDDPVMVLSYTKMLGALLGAG